MSASLAIPILVAIGVLAGIAAFFNFSNSRANLNRGRRRLSEEMRAGNLAAQYPDTNKDNVVFVRNEMARRTSGNGLLIPAVLMGLVILVLLIACANVASLMMAKATSRLREISTQLAIGASRGTLVRQFLTESAVLATIGGVVGILFAYGCIKLFRTLVPVAAGPGAPEFRLDLRVLACAGIVHPN